MRFSFCIIVLIISISKCIIAYETNLSPKCLKMEDPRNIHMLKPGDGGFMIDIRDLSGKMIDRFTPGMKYIVDIKNKMFGIRFRNFYLTSSLEMDMKMMKNMPKLNEDNIGRFMISSNKGRVENKCPNKVYNNDLFLKRNIIFYWKAPKYPVKCVIFHGKIVKSYSMVFSNEGKLKKRICPTLMHEIMNNKVSSERKLLPPMVKECCACGEATYKVTFQGLWSKMSHPKEWPQHKNMLHWTNPIGVTHDENYFVYYLGGYADSGVSSVCSYGDNTMLKKMFRRAEIRDHLKSLFTTSGMWNEDDLLLNRTGYISVNRTYHLFSFLSMMGPSPDWCTGVAAVDLCQKDCSWHDEFSLDLWPWDAGIKHGYTYLPENSDSLDIPNPITLINSTTMPQYPFTPGRPVARVTFTREDPMYSWQCSSKPLDKVHEFHSQASSKSMSSQMSNGDGAGLFKKKRGRSKQSSVLDDPSLRQMTTFLCITSEWSLWSACSVTCGIGTRMRSRQMLKNLKNELCRHMTLVEKQDCEGRKRSCDFSQPCSLLPWSQWSPCNATCDQMQGYQSRQRSFVRQSDIPKCPKPRELMQYRQCKQPANLCDPVVICSEGLLEGLPCGKPSNRYWYDARENKCRKFSYRGCKGSLNRFSSKEKCEMVCLPAIAALPQWKKDKLALLQFQSVADKQSPSSAKKYLIEMDKKCYKYLDHGKVGRSCTKSQQRNSIRYYYSMRSDKCRAFKYSYCSGSIDDSNMMNNFPDYVACVDSCMPMKSHVMKKAPKHDCQVSAWSSWGPCSSNRCDVDGRMHRWRQIERPPINGGKSCGDLVQEVACRPKHCVINST